MAIDNVSMDLFWLVLLSGSSSAEDGCNGNYANQDILQIPSTLKNPDHGCIYLLKSMEPILLPNKAYDQHVLQ